MPINVSTVRTSAAQPIATREMVMHISPLALHTLFVPELLGLQNIPDVGTQNGNLFVDRFDSALHWYVPHFALADTPDSSFSFAATQTPELDSQGNPFRKARLNLSLKKRPA
jgi:hypothetical protein